MACLRPYRGIFPQIADDAFVAETAVVIGKVKIGARASVWPSCVLRGDVNHIVIGADTNIQDGTVIHVESDAFAKQRGGDKGFPTLIGNGVTVGHMALLHACEVADGALVGMGSIVMDGAFVAEESLLAAGALLPPSKKMTPRTLWSGRPAREVRALREDEIAWLKSSAERYVALAEEYRATEAQPQNHNPRNDKTKEQSQ